MSRSCRVVLIVPCGVSILQNLLTKSDKFRQKLREVTGRDVQDIKLLENELRDVLLRELSLDISRRVLFNVAVSEVCNNPELYSAELSTILKLRCWLERQYGQVDDIRVCLILTDSITCRFCGEVIVEYVRRLSQSDGKMQVDSVACIHALKLPARNVEIFQRSLDVLADLFVRKVCTYTRRGYDVYLLITGGLKIEIAYLTVLAFLVNARVVYCPSPESNVIVLPPLPIELSRTLVDIIKRKDVTHPDVEKYVKLGLVEVQDGTIRVKSWIEKLVQSLA